MTPADAAHADGTGYPPAQGATTPSKAAPPADIEVAFGDDAAGAVGSAEPLESAAATEIGDGDHEPLRPIPNSDSPPAHAVRGSSRRGDGY
jgi:hypothetical protein